MLARRQGATQFSLISLFLLRKIHRVQSDNRVGSYPAPSRASHSSSHLML